MGGRVKFNSFQVQRREATSSNKSALSRPSRNANTRVQDASSNNAREQAKRRLRHEGAATAEMTYEKSEEPVERVKPMSCPFSMSGRPRESFGARSTLVPMGVVVLCWPDRWARSALCILFVGSEQKATIETSSDFDRSVLMIRSMIGSNRTYSRTWTASKSNETKTTPSCPTLAGHGTARSIAEARLSIRGRVPAGR